VVSLIDGQQIFVQTRGPNAHERRTVASPLPQWIHSSLFPRVPALILVGRSHTVRVVRKEVERPPNDAFCVSDHNGASLGAGCDGALVPVVRRGTCSVAGVPMIILTLLLALVAPASQPAPEIQVNLVAVPPPPERPADHTPGAGCGSGTSSALGEPHRLKVTLADTDRRAYAVGDGMSFNVILENNRSSPIVLGISRDPEVAPKTTQPCRVVPPGVRFGVALVAMTTKGTGAIIASGFAFYGSLDVPGTTVVLQPGERARVQVPAQVGTGGVRTTESRSVRIKALVMIEREELQLGELSENTLQIELTPRRSSP
jgi:hypothetical protein